MSRWPSSESYYDFADRNVLVVVNIEEGSAVENIDAIAATSGIDVLFIGTSDLAFSLGVRGQQDHPKVQEAMAKIVAAGKAHGKVLGAPAGDTDQVRKLLQQGFLFFQTRTELGLMTLGARQILDPLGKTPIEPQAQALY
jgi:2-keto-3-deoxy-L-rhamnonate aldolase RhmA